MQQLIPGRAFLVATFALVAAVLLMGAGAKKHAAVDPWIGANGETITNSTDGVITFSGSLDAPRRVSTAASGTLSANRITTLTATADYTISDCTTAAVGRWYTVIVRDASETASILLADSSDVINYSGITPVAGDELDSPTAGATTAGSTVTLVCVADDNYSAINTVGLWVDGGAS